MPANAEFLRAWIPHQRDRWLTLYLAGQVFGGRPGEAPLELTRGTFDGSAALLEFRDGESLVVHEPSGLVIASGDLIIPGAAEVRFGWYSYGSTQTPENRCELVYRLANGHVSVVATGPAVAWHPAETFALGQRPMVRLS